MDGRRRLRRRILLVVHRETCASFTDDCAALLLIAVSFYDSKQTAETTVNLDVGGVREKCQE